MKYFITSHLSDNISETPEGFLVCTGVAIARTGEMVYGPGESPIEVGPDGIARVYRDAREVFRPETLASFEGKAFTIQHPEDFVGPKNWSVLAKGMIQNVRRGRGENANDIVADILVTDEEAIKLVRGGVREVSCGYECEYIQTGIGLGMQTNIIGNHVALVEQGRAGSSYAINDQQGAKMSKLSEKIKGIFAKAGDEAAKVADEASNGAGDKADKEEIPKWAKTFMTTVTDAMTQIASMSQPSKMADEEEEEKKKSKDEDKEDKKSEDADMPPWADAICKRLDALEGKGKDEDKDDEKSEDEESEEMSDEDMDEEESEDDDFEETPAASAHDEASRIEILAPGSKFSGKDAKRKALKKACESKDTAAIITNLNGGKKIDFKKASQKTIDHLFIGAAEVVSLYRTKDFTKWKQVRDSQTTEFGASEGMSPEKINEINAKHYNEGAH